MIDSRVLDNFSLYWPTNSATSAARLYWENREQNLLSAASQKTDEIGIPVPSWCSLTNSIEPRRRGLGAPSAA